MTPGFWRLKSSELALSLARGVGNGIVSWRGGPYRPSRAMEVCLNGRRERLRGKRNGRRRAPVRHNRSTGTRATGPINSVCADHSVRLHRQR